MYHQKGRQIPEGWAFDAEGQPTTDPAAAIGGLIQPVGQHKGIGLAVVMGMLSTLLSGASYGTELRRYGRWRQSRATTAISLLRSTSQRSGRSKRCRPGRIRSAGRSSRAERRTPATRLYPPGLLEAEFERVYGRGRHPAQRGHRRRHSVGGPKIGIAWRGVGVKPQPASRRAFARVDPGIDRFLEILATGNRPAPRGVAKRHSADAGSGITNPANLGR